MVKQLEKGDRKMEEKGKVYEITVHGMRKVEPVVLQEYRVTAENREAAELLARTDYHVAYPDVDTGSISVSLKGGWNVKAIICLTIACLLCFVDWQDSKGVKFDLMPNLISTLFAIFIYSAFVVRNKGLQNSLNHRSEIVLVCLNVFFCASFLTLFVGDVTITIPWTFKLLNIKLSGVKVLCLAGLLSWLCIPAMAGIVWLLLFLIAFKRFSLLNSAMGPWGVVYILSAFLGIVFQLKQESHYVLKSLRNDILGIAARSVKRVKKDIGASVSAAKVVAGSVASIAATAATGVPVNLSTNNTGASANTADTQNN
jgi:hypothetical protein